MSIEKRRETPQERWQRANMKAYAFKVSISTEQDVIVKLDSVPNKAGYIKQLIRDDIEQELTPDKDGFITLTIPKTLHRELSKVADKEGISLEQYVLYMLAK